MKKNYDDEKVVYKTRTLNKRYQLTRKDLAAKVLMLSEKEGFCYASNGELAKVLNTDPQDVANKIYEMKKENEMRVEKFIDEQGYKKRRLFYLLEKQEKLQNEVEGEFSQDLRKNYHELRKNNHEKRKNYKENRFLQGGENDSTTSPEPQFFTGGKQRETKDKTKAKQNNPANLPQAQNSTSSTSSPNAAAAFSDENKLMNRLRAIGVSESKASGLVKKVCDDNDELTASMLTDGMTLIANERRIDNKAGYLLKLVDKGELGDYIDRKQKEQQTQAINLSVEEHREKEAQLERDFKNVDHKFTYLVKDHDLSEKTDRETPQSFIFNLTALLDSYPQLTRPTPLTATLNGEYVNLPGLRKKYQGIGAGQTPQPKLQASQAKDKPHPLDKLMETYGRRTGKSSQSTTHIAKVLGSMTSDKTTAAKPKNTLDQASKSPENIPEKPSGKSHKMPKVSNDRTLVWRYIANHGEVSRKELEEAFEGVLGLKMIQRKLKALIDKGFIEAIGNTTNRKYRLKKA